ncbi:MAG TPA: hypothetical protein GXX31_05840 [Methanothermobacter sp.]|nr:hypothetical protein [Methanothermobacter sp.]
MIISLILIIAIVTYTFTHESNDKNTFSGEYFSFKIPEGMEITNHALNLTGACREIVLLRKDDEYTISVAVFDNISLEDLEANNTGIFYKRSTVGEVTCDTYYNPDTKTTFYYFEMNGKVFLVTFSPIHGTYDAEDIIKSLELKK